mgnify:CR=1 FL=1
MRHLLASSLLAASVLLTVSVLVAAPSSQGQAPQSTALASEMDAIKSELKGLAMTLRAAPLDAAKALAHVHELEAHLLAAKRLDPPKLSELPEAERAAHLTEYRRDMVAALDLMLKLELDVLSGDAKSAFEKVSGPLFQHREASHGKYQKK